MSGQFHLQIGEIGIESLTKTDGSTILRDKHTAGSGQGGCNLNLLRCKINLSLGLSLPGLYKTGRCFSRSPQLQRKTRHSSHSGLPRSLEPPILLTRARTGNTATTAIFPTRIKSLQPSHFRILSNTRASDSGAEDLSRKMRPRVWRKWLCV